MELIPDKNIKPWQHGVPRYVLDEIKSVYDAKYNKFAFSPFNEMNAPAIALAIHQNTLFQHPKKEAFVIAKKLQRRTPIVCLGNVVGNYEPDDLLYRAVTYTTNEGKKSIEKSLQVNCESHCFIDIWEEDEDLSNFVWNLNFKKICLKVRSTGELIGVYYKAPDKKSPRIFKGVPDIDIVGIRTLRTDTVFSPAQKIAEKLKGIEKFAVWKEHYSNYNNGKSWSALSLHGYSSDVTFIEKPDEIRNNAKFKDVNLDNCKLQKTALYDIFEDELNSILSIFGPEAQFDRIRFMRLKKGSLGRHTDLADPSSGTQDGKTMRFHIPIVTNLNVEFHVWDYDGTERKIHLPAGSLTFLDTRYPHAVTNESAEERIHLVIDVLANSHVRTLCLR